ncbi:MAG: redoxin domain-containing protein [Phaeodactylibacter sp.]|uniref:redoxin domain-containing protein n=1 Tax=Phaeodactylibacter sp. TaxID=1940289 RepID=UPI0032EBD416
MKRLLTLCALSLSLQLAVAQVSITEAPDFTLTDIHGEEHHLYDMLDDGKYVMIKLYAYWCGPCCATAPAVKQVYENFGCNSGDLIVIGLEADGTLAQTEAFENDCGAAGGFPVVSGLDGGASAVVDQFAPIAFPTTILVAPDRTIVQQDIWPFEADGATALVESYGPAQQECAPVSASDVELLTGFTAAAQPNPFTETLSVTGTIETPARIRIEVLNTLGQIVLQHDAGQWATGEHTARIPATQLTNGHYFVHILADGVPAATLNVQKQ